MAQTTVTTIFLVLLGSGLLAMASYAWFGSWQPEPKRVTLEDQLDAEYRDGVRQMRQAIEEYERGHRTL